MAVLGALTNEPYCLMHGLPEVSFWTGAAVASRESTC